MSLRRLSQGLSAIWLLAALAVGHAGPADRPPRFLEGPKPAYPPALREERIIGWADVICTVGADGSVSGASVEEESVDGFGRAAVEAVEKFHYEPAVRNGEPASVQVRVPIDFEFSAADMADWEAKRSAERLPDGPAPLEVNAVDVWPELKSQTRPGSPYSIVGKRRMGLVRVAFIVDERGLPRDVHRIAATDRNCAREAEAAVARWRFSPGVKNGRAVRVALVVPVVFFPENPSTNGARVRPGVVDRIDLSVLGPEANRDYSEPARMLVPPKIEYPDEMRLRSRDGGVTVDIIVDASGTVTHVCAIEQSHGLFAALAERALSYAKFRPARRDGVTVPSYLRQVVTFTMEK